jgi:AcrR family transcriptional regulator
MTAKPPSLRERQRLDLRHRVHRSALAMFARDGYDAVTMEQLAAEVGISLSTLFRHMRTKDELFVGVLEVGRAEVVANVRRLSESTDVVSALGAAILLRTEQFEGEPDLELWRRAMTSAPERVRRSALFAEDERAELVAVVEDRAPDLDAGLVVTVLLAATAYAYEQWLRGDGSEGLHALTRRALAGVRLDPTQINPAPR